MSEPENSPFLEHPALEHAAINWDADGQPVSRTFGDVYFSRANGLEETRHVFLHHNHLTQRWKNLQKDQALEHSASTADVFNIGETGFGSGLNFLAAWQLWDQIAPVNAQLHFVSVEKFPLSKKDLIRALSLWPELAPLAAELIDQYPSFTGRGFHRLKFRDGKIHLTLIIDDAAAGFAQLLGSAHPLFAGECTKIHAWFLDGFAPSKNPQMWSAELFNVINQLSEKNTTATTFSAARLVKNGLESAGFSVKKVAGFGRKREMVSAVYAEVAQPLLDENPPTENQSDRPPLLSKSTAGASLTPWALVRDQQQGRNKKEARSGEKKLAQRVVIIGGGLAGCHTARALAERNWQVTLIERHPQLAMGASGNPQGVLYAKLSHKQEPQAAFNLACLQFALRHYRCYWNRFAADSNALIAQDCGVLQIAHKPAEARLHQLLSGKFAEAKDFVRFVDAQTASEIAGVSLQQSGIYFPDSGWINPQLLCKALVQHPGITIRCNTDVLSLHQHPHGWQIIDHHGDLFCESPHVVIATARDAKHFAQCAYLPIKSIRGQISYLPASIASQQLKTVLCGEGYIAPATELNNQHFHCTGATFNLNDESDAVRQQDHQTNIENLRQHLPAMMDLVGPLNTQECQGRVAFRCTAPDYLPLLGPLPDRAAFLRDYAPLRKNAKAGVPLAGQYLAGLYINIGHGSRGLAYTPLSAEILAAQMCQQILPVSRELADTLNPARFIIRDLMRNKI